MTNFYNILAEQSKQNEASFLITVVHAQTKDLIAEKILITPEQVFFSSAVIKSFWQENHTAIPLQTGTFLIQNNTLFIEKLMQSPQLVLCGAGHISEPLCQIGAMLGFSVIVIDDRKDFAHKERFPAAKQILCGDFEQILSDFTFTANTYFVIITRGHLNDRLCLTTILPHQFAYVGMIGSRHKTKLILDYLKNAGFSSEKLAQVYTPIGLSIGAQTPAEIAVSISAQIIEIKYKSDLSTCFASNFFEKLQQQANCALATVVKKSGSVPATLGSRMIVSKTGRLFGTIGGGKAEYEAICQAQSIIENKTPKTISFSMTNTDAEKAAMTCGGEIEVLIEPILHYEAV